MASLPKTVTVDNGDQIAIDWSDALLPLPVGGANPRNPGMPAKFPAGLVYVSGVVKKTTPVGLNPMLRSPPLPNTVPVTNATATFATGTLAYRPLAGPIALPSQFANYAANATAAAEPTVTATVGGTPNVTLVRGLDFDVTYYATATVDRVQGESILYDQFTFTPTRPGARLPDNGTSFKMNYNRIVVEQGTLSFEYVECVLHLYVSDLNGTPQAPDRGSTRYIAAARLTPMLVSALSVALDGLKGSPLGGVVGILTAPAGTFQPTFGRLSFGKHDTYAPALGNPLVKFEGPVHSIVRLLLHHMKMGATSSDQAISRIVPSTVEAV